MAKDVPAEQDKGGVAAIWRMDMPDHLCPFGLKAKHVLASAGYTVEDHRLTSREETDAFQREHDVETTPQVFIGGERIGGYDEVREYLGKPPAEPEGATYRPVIALFGMAALIALAAAQAVYGTVLLVRTLEWFVAIAMCLLALMKLRDVESFSNMFLGYDLLAQRWVPYAYVYPHAEAFAGVLMIAGVFGFLSGPVALFIGAVGAVSVFKAVYIDRRELKCACVGGDSDVPLGFISLTENVMMVAMGAWTLAKLAL